MSIGPFITVLLVMGSVVEGIYYSAMVSVTYYDVDKAYENHSAMSANILLLTLILIAVTVILMVITIVVSVR